MPQQPLSADLTISRTARLNYLLFLPQGYDAASGQRWPLILFLHGMGERGDDLELVKKDGLAKKLETWPECPFIVVSPQCPDDSFWTFEVEVLNALLVEVMGHYAVDPARVYLTGLSMGGAGTFQLAIIHPEYFAAIAPICGPILPILIDRIKEIPTWVFHGAKDSLVPIAWSELMVSALKAAGGDVRFTVYPEAAHDSWTAAYDDPALYEWMLAHKKA